MPVIDELVTILGVDIAKDAMAKLESFKAGVDKAKGVLMGISVAITGAAATMGLMVKGAADNAFEIQKLSEKTGIGTESLQAWGYAAQQAGGDAKALQNDILGLQSRFAMTGETAENALLSLADQMKGMSGTQARVLGNAWGISEETIMLLRKGRDGIADLKEEAKKLGGIIPDESIKKAAEFRLKMNEMKFILHGITQQVAIAMIPAISRVMDLFKKWIGANREWISSGIETFMSGLVMGFEGFWSIMQKLGKMFEPIIKSIKPFVGSMETVEMVAHLVRGALVGLLVVFSPLIAKIALITAAVIAASLVFEDLFVSITTGEGAFADLFREFESRWPDLANAVKAIGRFIKENFTDALKAAMGVAKEFFGVLGELTAKILDGFNAMIVPVFKFFDTFDKRFPALFALLEKFGEMAEKFITFVAGAAVEKLKKNLESLFELLGIIGKTIEATVGKVDGYIQSKKDQKDAVVGAFKTASDFWAGFLGADKKKNDPVRHAVSDPKHSRPEPGPASAQKSVPMSESGISTDIGKVGHAPSEGATSASDVSVKVSPATINVPVQGGSKKTQYNDNRTQNFHVSTSDPIQAGEAAAARANQSLWSPGGMASAGGF